MTQLAGAVAFIDDEIDEPASDAAQLLQEIRSTGRPVATSKELPPDPEGWFAHWQGLAFAVVDWDLMSGVGGGGGSLGSVGGATLSKFARARLFEFVTSLLSSVYCPVFIVSGEDVQDIQRQITDEGVWLDSEGNLDRRIRVFPKSGVLEHLDERLEEWLVESPSMTALAAWAREAERARNKMFLALDSAAPEWPLYVWQSAELDQVDPGAELASVMNTNLVSRISPIVFDSARMGEAPQAGGGSASRRVLQGRTTLLKDALVEGATSPGDLFVLPEAEEGEVWVNVSPACQTVGRLTGKTDDAGNPIRQPIRLHLLRGRRLNPPTTEKMLTEMSKATTNSLTLHTVLDGDPFKFFFGEAQICEWDTIADHRVGRLLPPFVTKLQQLHAAYIQSEGLPRITFSLYE